MTARFGPDRHTPPEDSEAPFDCPDCERSFDTEHGLAVHRGHAHEDTTPEVTTCDHCGTEFEVPSESNGAFCSRDCFRAATMNRVTVTCEQCGEGFEVQGHLADQRKYCSHKCYGESQQRQERRTCAACKRTFSVNVRNQNRHCSHACQAEARTSKPRPDDVDGLLWVLYVYEGHNARETWLRANANLDPDEQLTQQAAKERLRENDWMRPGAGVPKYGDLSIEDVGLGEDERPGDRTWQKYYRPERADSGGESA